MTGRVVSERRLPGPVPAFAHGPWASGFPWLVQGTTARGDASPPFDLGLFGAEGGGVVLGRWWRLLESLGVDGAVHGVQVHGADVRVHHEHPPGIHVQRGVDGHLTRQPGLLLAVTVADCVPVTLVHPASRTVGLLHAGWRGVAAGILERGIAGLAERFDVPARELRVHLGPCASGERYEVGPEVFDAVGAPPPDGPAPIDLREILASRAAGLGVPEDAITRSGHCTMDPASPFFSHRRGDAGRQVAFVAVRRP